MKRILLLLLLQLLIEPGLLAQGNRVVGPDTRNIDQVARGFFNQTQNDGPGGGSGGGEINAITERIFSGLVAGDEFGTSVSGAGDVNGDGYEDIIVGAPLNDAGGSSAGRAYIFFGGAVFNLIADVVLTGAAASDQFGFSAASAGDVNGDGYADVIVGAPFNDAGGNSAGRAYIYFGGTVFNTAVDVILTGVAAGDQFGVSVASAGDVNSDGYQDIVVGANRATASDTGKAYIYLGGASMNNIVDVTLSGAAAGDQFGLSVAGAGDVNGDGYSDVIVGGLFNDAGGANAGGAYVFFGGAPMNNVADVTMTGANGENLGQSVTGAGDLNGDGYHDVAVGAPLNDAGLSNAGAVFIFYGGSPMNNIVDVTMYGSSTSDLLGVCVKGAGDVNGDGYDDLLAGANLAGELNTGRAYLYFGGAPMNNGVDAAFLGEAASDQFGDALGASDYNGDGYPEMLVGAHFAASNGADGGRVYLYQQSMTGLDIPDEVFIGTTNQRLGINIAGGGDMNRDGYDDFVIVDATSVRMFLGGPTIDKTEDWKIATPNNTGRTTPASAGDLNGDGYGDLIISQWDSNEVYVYFGGAIPDTVRDRTILAPAGAINFGISLASAGDVNGDGFGDIIVGATQQNTSARAYIYFGGSSMNTTPDVTFTAGLSEVFGASVAGGDLNGDGYSDVAVGAYDYGTVSNGAGRVYVYLGGSAMDNTADVIIQGTYDNNRVGWDVAIGDINGDAFADLMIGNRDSIYVVHGGSVIQNQYDAFLYASEALTYCRFAGDVNGDGYGDVFADGGTAATRAFVFFGGPGMDSAPDVILEGEAPGFGREDIAAGGDINNDGLNDLIVSDGLNDISGTWSGRTYIYLSSSPAIHPKIISVKDVPFDQGGRVTVTWLRSGFDVGGPNQIVDYVVQRSLPPGGGNFVWSNIATLPATREPRYSFDAETPYDSSSNTSGTFYFRILARRASGLEQWISAAVPGHSLDNLSPSTPLSPLLAPISSTHVRIQWNPNTTDPDLHHYAVYRSITNGFPLADSARLVTTTSATVEDSTVLANEDYYYRVTAVDVHDNESIPTGQLLSPNALSSRASIKMFLEGPYNSGTLQMNRTLNAGGFLATHFTGIPIPTDAVDSITIELRNASSASGSTTRKYRPAWLLTDGTIRSFTDTTKNYVEFDTLAGNYYLVIYHRNHIPIMTAATQQLNGAPPLPYDFTTAQGQAFGSNPMKALAGGKFGMIAGDASGNSQVATSDINSIIRPRLGQSGYQNADISLNGQIQNSDINTFTRPNLGRGSQIPSMPNTIEKETDQ